MGSKILAATQAVDRGVKAVIIAKGTRLGVISDIVNGKNVTLQCFM